MTLDAERGIVYMPVAPTGGPDFYGGVRLGDRLFGDSVVALDANTGKLIWYRQLVHHDLWDWDVPGTPTLFDMTRDGKTIPGVAESASRACCSCSTASQASRSLASKSVPCRRPPSPATKLRRRSPFR